MVMIPVHSLLARSCLHWVQGHRAACPAGGAEMEELVAQALALEVSSLALASRTGRPVGAFCVGWCLLASSRGQGPSWGVSGYAMVS